MAALAIRYQQLEVFLEIERKRFVDKTLSFLTNDHPDLLGEKPLEQKREQVIALIERAESLDFHLHSDVAQFVVLVLTLGEDFESVPKYSPIRDLLHDAEIEPTLRISKIRQLLNGEPEHTLQP